MKQTKTLREADILIFDSQQQKQKIRPHWMEAMGIPAS